MNSQPGATLQRILDKRIIAVLRLERSDHALDIVDAITDAGITIIEVTLTTPGALALVHRLSARGDLLVGVGTVMSIADSRAALDAGGRFLASPVSSALFVEQLHTACNTDGYHAALMPGGYTPSEIHTAWEHGADIVKVFPMPLEPRAFIASIHAPLPHIRLAPSGGVTDLTATDLLRAGASALNVGSWLTGRGDGSTDLTEVRLRAERLVQLVGVGR